MKTKNALLSVSEQQQGEQKKQQVTTVASPSAVPEGWLEELARFQKAVARNAGQASFFGKMMRFRKGDWVRGQDKEQVPDRSRWIAIMSEARHGWITWTTVTTEDGDTKRVPVHVIGKISEGYEPPPRESLGDMDKTQWRIGLNGKLEDPWKKVAYLPLLSLDGETVMTFTTDTPTGLPRFWRLIDKYQWLGRGHVGQDPVIELRASGYEDRRYGWVDTPDFSIVDWVDRPDPARLLGHAGEDSEGDGFDEPPPHDVIPQEYDDQE
jgi:hypothetical protein